MKQMLSRWWIEGHWWIIWNLIFWGEERLRGNYDDGSSRAPAWTCRCTKLVCSTRYFPKFGLSSENYHDSEFNFFHLRWIYLVAALCGILLLLTIVLILAKVVPSDEYCQTHSWMLQLGFFKRKRPEEADDVDFMVSANFEKVRLSDDLWSKWLPGGQLLTLPELWRCRLKKKSNSVVICDGSIQTGPTGKSYLYRTPDRSLMVRVKLKSDN